MRLSYLTFVSLIVSVINFGLVTISFAATYYEYKSGVTIKEGISATGLNRIKFGTQGVVEVIGDESKYQLLSDNDGSNIFILPKVDVGSSFSISLIGSNTEVQDMELTSRNIGSTSIIISLDKPYNNQGKQQEQEEIIQMLRSMKKGIKGKYYVREDNSKVNVPNLLARGLKVIRLYTYQYDNLNGVILEVSNEEKSLKLLKEEEFSNIYAGTVAVSVPKQLTYRGRAKIFIITKNINEVKNLGAKI